MTKARMKYFELFGELPFMTITSTISEERFEARIIECIEKGVRMEELYPDEYNEPEGTLV